MKYGKKKKVKFSKKTCNFTSKMLFLGLNPGTHAARKFSFLLDFNSIYLKNGQRPSSHGKR